MQERHAVEGWGHGLPNAVAQDRSVLHERRRVIYQDAYVAVPVTGTVVKANADGTGSVDTNTLFAEAIRISQDDRVEWKVEQESTETHPLQIPMPDGRVSFDAHYMMKPKRRPSGSAQ